MIPDPLTQLSAYVVAAGSGIIGWAGSVERRLRGHDDEIDQVRRRQVGDDADPTNEGILREVADLERDVEQIDAKLERARSERKEEHAHVMDRLDELEDKIDA